MESKKTIYINISSNLPLFTKVTRSKSKEAKEIGLSDLAFRRMVDVSVRLKRCVEAERQILLRPRKIVNRRRSVAIGQVQQPKRIQVRRPSLQPSGSCPQKLQLRRPFYTNGRRPSISADNQGIIELYLAQKYFHRFSSLHSL